MRGRAGCGGRLWAPAAPPRPARFSSSSDAPRRSRGRTQPRLGAGQAGRGAQSPGSGGRGCTGPTPVPPGPCRQARCSSEPDVGLAARVSGADLAVAVRGGRGAGLGQTPGDVGRAQRCRARSPSSCLTGNLEPGRAPGAEWCRGVNPAGARPPSCDPGVGATAVGDRGPSWSACLWGCVRCRGRSPSTCPMWRQQSLRDSGVRRGAGCCRVLGGQGDRAGRYLVGGSRRSSPVPGTDAAPPSRWAWVLQDALGIAFCLYTLKTIRLPTFKVRALRGGAWASPGLVPPGSALAFPSEAGPEVTVRPTPWRALRSHRDCDSASQPLPSAASCAGAA